MSLSKLKHDPNNHSHIGNPELLAYVEKFDTSLKLEPLYNILDKWKEDDVPINEAIGLKPHKPDFHMSEKLFSDDPSQYTASSCFVAYWFRYGFVPSLSKSLRRLEKWMAHKNSQIMVDAWKLASDLNYGFLISGLPAKSTKKTTEAHRQWMEDLSGHPWFNHILTLLKIDRLAINRHKRLTKICSDWMSKGSRDGSDLTPVSINIPEMGLDLKMGWDIGCLTVKGRSFMIDRDCFTLFINKIGELACCLLYTMAQTVTFENKGPEKLVELLTLFSETLCARFRRNQPKNQEGFNLVKAFEAIGVGYVIEKEDRRRGFHNEEFIRNIMSGLHDEGLLDGVCYKESRLYKFMCSLTPPEVTELLGCSKILGHPSIEFEAGLKKLFTRTHQEIIPNKVAVTEAIGCLKFDFIVMYHKRTKQWPNLDRNTLPDNLKRAFDTNMSPSQMISQQTIGLTWTDWSQITLLKSIEYDYWNSPFSFLKDTALSPNYAAALGYCLEYKLRPEESFQFYQKKGWGKRSRKLRESNRMIIQFLLSDAGYWEGVDYRQKWGSVQNIDNLAQEFQTYWVIKLTSKEKEMKREGRFFGASPAPERDRRVNMEGELYKYMRKFVPEQMLTATELEFNQKLIKFRNYRNLYPNHHVVQLCFDFSAWNNYMRSSFVDEGIGKVLDGIFDTYAYSKVMKFYEQALFWHESTTDISAWKGQLGGIEGLNQATWTLATLCGLKIALGRAGHPFEVSVKGDDCRAAIRISKFDVPLSQLASEIERIKAVLVNYSADFGFCIKPEETFTSISLIASSKQYQVDDIIMPCGLKLALKMAHHSNTAFPGLQDTMSDIMSAAHSACFQSPFIIQTWCIGVLVSLVRINLDFPLFHKLNFFQVTALSLWPQVLGGPGILPLEVFLVRGENDMLSITLSLYQYIMKRLGSDHPVCVCLWRTLCVPDRSEKSFRLLLSDTYSLNRDHPISPSAYLRTVLRERIKRIARNPMITVLSEQEQEIAWDVFLESITSMNPFNCKMATCLYENSPFAILDSILSRIDNSASIYALIGAHRGVTRSRLSKKVLAVASAHHRKQQSWWLNVILTGLQDHFYNLTIDEFISQCPTKSAQDARVQSWGLPIYGVTYPSLVSQFSFFDYNDPTTITTSVVYLNDCFKFTLLGTNETHDQVSHPHIFFRAPDNPNPWIGGKTDAKMRLPDRPDLQKSAALPKVMMLLELLARISVLNTDVIRFIKWLVRMMVDLSDSDFEALLPQITSGSAAHRLNVSSFSLTTTPNFRHNILQLGNSGFEQNNFLQQNRDKDFSINFLAVHIFYIYTLNFPAHFSSDVLPTRVWRGLFTDEDHKTVGWRGRPCRSCVADVTDRPFVMTVPHFLPIVNFRQSLLAALPESDHRNLEKMLEVVKDQRELHSLTLLQVAAPGSRQFLLFSHYAMISKMISDSKALHLDMNREAPGALWSNEAIRAMNFSYNPFSIKFIIMMDPNIIAEELFRGQLLEILSLIPTVCLEDRSMSPAVFRGIQATFLPIWGEIIKSGMQHAVAMTIHSMQRQMNIGEDISGVVLTTAHTINQWVVKVAFQRAVQMWEANTSPSVRILTTQDCNKDQLRGVVLAKVEQVRRIAIRQKWNDVIFDTNWFHHQGIVPTGVPCPHLCSRNNQSIEFTLLGIINSNNMPLAIELASILIGPLTVVPSMSTNVEIDQAYRTPGPVPLLKMGPIDMSVLDEADYWASLKRSLGINIWKMITGKCCQTGRLYAGGIKTFKHAIDAIFYSMAQDQRFAIGVESYINNMLSRHHSGEVIHLELEAAEKEIIDHPHQSPNLLSTLRARLDDPGNHQVYSRIAFNCPRMDYKPKATSINAAPDDILNPKNLLNNPEVNLQAAISKTVSANQHHRIKGYTGTAASKLHDIIRFINVQRLSQQAPGVALCLADGYGGFSTYLLQKFPQFSVIFNTRADVDCDALVIPSDAITNKVPPSRLITYVPQTGDIRDPTEQSILCHVASTHTFGQGCQIITCDAESPLDIELGDYNSVIEGALRIASVSLHKDGLFILKLIWQDGLALQPSLQYIIDQNVHLAVVKPLSSRESNQEIYLVVHGFLLSYSTWLAKSQGRCHLHRWRHFRQCMLQVNRDILRQRQDIIYGLSSRLHAMWNSPYPPPLLMATIESRLGIPPGTLKLPGHWTGGYIIDVFFSELEYSECVRTETPPKGRHKNRGYSVRGKDLMSYKRLTNAIDISFRVGSFNHIMDKLDILTGNRDPNWTSLQTLHGPVLERELSAEYHKKRQDWEGTKWFNNCLVHRDCITSEGSSEDWVSRPIHINTHRLWTTGADVAVVVWTWLRIGHDSGNYAQLIDYLCTGDPTIKSVYPFNYQPPAQNP